MIDPHFSATGRQSGRVFKVRIGHVIQTLVGLGTGVKTSGGRASLQIPKEVPVVPKGIKAGIGIQVGMKDAIVHAIGTTVDFETGHNFFTAIIETTFRHQAAFSVFPQWRRKL